MRYTFNGGPMFGETTVEFDETAIKLINKKGRVKRQIAFYDLQEIHEYVGTTALDEHRNRFSVEFCKLVARKGRAIVFQSSSFIDRGPGYKQIAENKGLEFDRVKKAIKKRAVVCNPNVEAVFGNWTASILGIGLIVTGVAMQGLFIFGAMSTKMDFGEMWSAILIGAVPAIPLIYLGWKFQAAYRPVRIPIANTSTDD